MGEGRRPKNFDENALVYKGTLQGYAYDKRCQKKDLAVNSKLLWCTFIHPWMFHRGVEHYRLAHKPDSPTGSVMRQ